MEFDIDDVIRWPARRFWCIWCLSHNLEVAAGLAAMKHLGWVSGFSAGKTLAEFCVEAGQPEAIKEPSHWVDDPDRRLGI